MRQARQKRRLAPTRMMEAFHVEQACGPWRCAPDPAAVLIAGIFGSSSTAYQPDFLSSIQLRTRSPCSSPSVARDVVDKAAQSLPKRHHPQAFALATAVQQGVELRAQPLTHRGGQAHQLVGEFVERMA